MEYKKKYRVFLFEESDINGYTYASLVMGKNDYIMPKNFSDEFGTEEEAIEFCYEKGKYKTWIIVPQITFH